MARNVTRIENLIKKYVNGITVIFLVRNYVVEYSGE